MISDLYRSDLSIGDVADRTGAARSTLRIWEERHGFPRPRKLRSGHRRYSEEDCRAISAVLAYRREGVALPEAIERAAAERDRAVASIYDELQHLHPELEAKTLPGRFMLALSRAIEGQALVHGAGGVMAGAFEVTAAFRLARARWLALAGEASATMVLADFDRSHRDGSLWQVPIPSGAPIAREWAVICDSPAWTACVVGRERARSRDNPSIRSFDAIWSLEPGVVRSATRSAVSIAGPQCPELVDTAAPLLRAVALDGSETSQRCTEFVDRVLDDFLRQSTRRPRPPRDA